MKVNNTTRKILVLMLSMLLAVGTLSSCSLNKDDDKAEKQTVQATEATEETSDEESLAESESSDSDWDYSTSKKSSKSYKKSSKKSKKSKQSAVTPVTPNKQAVTIVYTNDIHGHINNSVNTKASDSKLTVSNVAQLAKDIRAQGKNVILVDAGDNLQGTSYSSFDAGNSMVELLNVAGYQLSAVGNHEFDYSKETFDELVKKAKYSYLSCNFRYIGNGANKLCLEPYRIVQYGGTKVAFIGISTPETISSSRPTYFQDNKGNFIYTFDGEKSSQDFYKSVQATIDSVRNQVDYVVGLGHVGNSDSEIKTGVDDEALIRNTSGMDALIGGHSHVLKSVSIEDKSGKEVLLTQTGSYLKGVGVMELGTSGNISNTILQEYSGVDASVKAKEDEIIANVNAKLGRQIATLDENMVTLKLGSTSDWLVRLQETNSGDLTADSFYWYFNELKKMNCDIAIQNGGGIRADIPKGVITYKNIKDVEPFGNICCMITATGQQIKDALEMGARLSPVGQNGGFLQVAGIKYTIDTSVDCHIVLDGENFVRVDGDYRVKDIQIYNKTTGEYENIDLGKKYNVAGINYLLRDSGNGLTMFKDCDVIVDYVGEDWELTSEYIEHFDKEGSYPRVNTANSPLKTYTNYLINYEQASGSGRITIF